MSTRAALAAALRDLYRQSWRFFLLNAALSVSVAAIAVAGFWAAPVWLLLPVAGPLAGALMHCAVAAAVTEELSLRDALTGLRLHWRRGLALGAIVTGGALAGVYAAIFYAGRGALVLAMLAVYLLVAFAVFQLALWPLAVFEFASPLGRVARDALRVILQRPLQALGLGLVLVAVNLVGAAVLLPFTLTIAYAFLAAARFALPPPSSREEVHDQWPA
jgi:uncharacterized protein (DUF697 family)